MSPSNERDAGFCSGSSENEEDLEHHHQIRLLNNSSECSSQSVPSSDDSALSDKFVLPVTPVTTTKNKRKSSEPIRVISEMSQSGPIKKRIKLENEKMMAKAQVEEAERQQLIQKLKQQQQVTVTATPMLSPDPFRPWALMTENSLSPAHSFKRHPGVTTLHRIPGDSGSPDSASPKFMAPVQEEPIALVSKNKQSPLKEPPQSPIRHMFMAKQTPTRHSLIEDSPRPAHMLSSRTPSLIDETSSTASSFVAPASHATTLNLSVKSSQGAATEKKSSGSSSNSGKDAGQRNYKNMTRERRMEANARERTRVHTISAAYEKLRQAVPAYSNTQKLSKLSVLRIACSYIMSLSTIAGQDYSEDQSAPSIADCVDSLTRTIQTEGKLRKKKDE